MCVPLSAVFYRPSRLLIIAGVRARDTGNLHRDISSYSEQLLSTARFVVEGMYNGTIPLHKAINLEPQAVVIADLILLTAYERLKATLVQWWLAMQLALEVESVPV